jgi:dihydroorotate dehydrogenase (NAD+) catalytic subunit
MKLRGVEWGHVMNASGARGFTGEGYWFHEFLWPIGLRYDGCTFVTKTTTMSKRPGNMWLDDDHQPLALMPDCIVVRPMTGVVLNAVGLSGPGAEAVLSRLLERRDLKPTVVSFMSVEADAKARFSEALSFLQMFWSFVELKGTDNVALQVNLSCPNVGLDPSSLVGEATEVLDATAPLGVATMIKLNALVPPDVACRIAEHDGCDAIVCSNTIPWGQLPDRIDWKGLFGSNESPLKRYGGGGLSGKPLLPIVEDWIRAAVRHGIKKPIVGGGGVLSWQDADRLLAAGASAIELGSISILRPWRVASVIDFVNRRLGGAS